MKDIYNDLKEEISEKYGEKEWENIDGIIERFWDKGDDISKVGEINGWEISETKEKINALQYNHEFTLTKNDMCIVLLFENGINNGTQLNKYSIGDGRLIPRTRKAEIIDDIVFDAKRCLASGHNQKISEIIFEQEKNNILRLYKNSDYDTYVTGVTQDYYRNKFKEYHNKGVYWEVIYKEIEVNTNFV